MTSKQGEISTNDYEYEIDTRKDTVDPQSAVFLQSLIPIQNKIWCVPKDANVWYQRLWLSFRIHGRVYQKIRRQKICGGDSKGKACQEVWSKRNEIPESLDHDSFKKIVCLLFYHEQDIKNGSRACSCIRYSILVYLQHKFVRLLRSL